MSNQLPYSFHKDKQAYFTMQEKVSLAHVLSFIKKSFLEKDTHRTNLSEIHKQHSCSATEAIQPLKDVARDDGNIFAELMSTVRVASLGQTSQALYEVGGQCRRSV